MLDASQEGLLAFVAVVRQQAACGPGGAEAFSRRGRTRHPGSANPPETETSRIATDLLPSASTRLAVSEGARRATASHGAGRDDLAPSSWNYTPPLMQARTTSRSAGAPLLDYACAVDSYRPRTHDPHLDAGEFNIDASTRARCATALEPRSPPRIGRHRALSAQRANTLAPGRGLCPSRAIPSPRVSTGSKWECRSRRRRIMEGDDTRSQLLRSSHRALPSARASIGSLLPTPGTAQSITGRPAPVRSRFVWARGLAGLHGAGDIPT